MTSVQSAARGLCVLASPPQSCSACPAPRRTPWPTRAGPSCPRRAAGTAAVLLRGGRAGCRPAGHGVGDQPGREAAHRTAAGRGRRQQPGGRRLRACGPKPRDTGAWITFAERTVKVPARTRADVPFTVGVPAGAVPGDHPGAIVASGGGRTAAVRIQSAGRRPDPVRAHGRGRAGTRRPDLVRPGQPRQHRADPEARRTRRRTVRRGARPRPAHPPRRTAPRPPRHASPSPGPTRPRSTRSTCGSRSRRRAGRATRRAVGAVRAVGRRWRRLMRGLVSCAGGAGMARTTSKAAPRTSGEPRGPGWIGSDPVGPNSRVRKSS